MGREPPAAWNLPSATSASEPSSKWRARSGGGSRAPPLRGRDSRPAPGRGAAIAAPSPELLEPDGRRRPVLPVVLYNGTAPWRAAREVSELIAPVPPSLAPYQPAQSYVVVDERRVRSDDAAEGNLMAAVAALEQSRSMEDLHGVAALARRGWARGEERLDLVFAKWLERLMRRLAPRDAPPPAVFTVEEARMTLEERVSQWPRQWRQEGLEQGIEQGRAQGIKEGRARERALLCRQAARKFSDDTSERLAAALAGVTDPNRLALVGDWVIECATAAELVARVGDEGRLGDRS